MDVLRFNYINSLPCPLMATLLGGTRFDVYDIEVDTGLVRINVNGLLEIKEMPEIDYFTDAAGVRHDPDTFYCDYVDN